MTITLDANPHRFGPFDHMSSYAAHHPQFTNPVWGSSSSAGPTSQAGSQGLYASSQDNTGLPHLNLGSLPKHPQHSSRTGSSASMASYSSLPVTASSSGSPPMSHAYRQQDLHSMSQDLLSLNRIQHPTTSAGYSTSAYTTASPVDTTYAPSPTQYDQLGYAQPPMRGAFSLTSDAGSRRYPQQQQQQQQQSVISSPMDIGGCVGEGMPFLGASFSDFGDHRALPHDDRRSFQDALEASHGMLSMSQDTPRNIYEVRNRGRGSADAYGFPTTHSASSSVSSASFNGYYGGSVDGSISDYSTAGSDIESLSGRTLPKPHGFMASHQLPAPASMMGSFSSKVSSSTQKKHQCKVCDKRFTRPSSLQTHMYSHTGEKPFSCDVEGCGRHFSVVSNLRRHRKVHKQGDSMSDAAMSETGSEDHHSE
ncbi:hypothetical protein B0T19DRAFT_44219 [Cercophora scortea]|uniref:C2H2-type domain-containing protein n=1 Tax=Cercophora scortea TaxID=314031 RepID=A0AAE0ML40_9PEZI|nr:hypothetical protein B0T19DRAFT_44219 [Cercophora scortea]